MANFGDWIVEELSKRDWKQADLARAAHLDGAVIHNLIHGYRNPGVETTTAIAKALGYPTEMVFREAGLLPRVTESTALYELMRYRIEELSPEQRKEVMAFIEWILYRDRSRREGGLDDEQDGDFRY